MDREQAAKYITEIEYMYFEYIKKYNVQPTKIKMNVDVFILLLKDTFDLLRIETLVLNEITIMGMHITLSSEIKTFEIITE